MSLWKCCTQYASKFGKLSSGHRTGKGPFSFQSQRKAMPKNGSNYCTIALISHAGKVMLKILQASLQQYMKLDLSDVQAGFRKGRRTRDQITNIHWTIEKAREFQKKTFTSALLTRPKPLTVSVQFSSVPQSRLTLYNAMNCSTPGFPVHHQLLESTQTHVHWVSDAIQPSHPLSSPSPPALNLSQQQGLFKWVSSLH